ncbi:MAG TPA: hypothetical protein VH351_03260 [Bryobacteraceae bacterium]|jgi:hypothetical protein|nr:hypothetical protein [Bryobacteraceae bacterium]
MGAASVGNVPPEVAERESAGDLAGARSLLEQEARSNDASATASLAVFLDRHHETGRRDALLKWAEFEKDPARRSLALRQAVLTDFMDGKSVELTQDLNAYRAAGGQDFALPPKTAGKPYSTILIPGPLSSFARMAAVTPDVEPEDLLPAFARTVVTNGYQASGNELLQQTEYLKLVIRYLGQARELQGLANANHQIVIPTCDSEQTGNLLKILGYRMRGSCGADISLETVNPTRAFITIDSGFPLSDLERDLRGNHRFELPYAPTPMPVLYDAKYWLAASGKAAEHVDFIETFASDPGLCRLYLGLSHLDHATAEILKAQMPAEKMRIYAAILDFYGSMFQVRNGAAVVPGSPKAWGSLAGASPSSPGPFFEHLLMTDDGWLAGYFDALTRLGDGPTRNYLTDSEHLRRFYEALRGRITSPGPARPVFRATSDLLLLTTSLRMDKDGTPHIPGNLDVWRTLFAKHPHGKYDARLSKSAPGWRSKDDLLEGLFALSRKTADNEPLKVFLALNDIDRDRSKPLSADTAARLIADYRQFGSQYRLFADTPALSEASMLHYLDFCKSTMEIRDTLLRSDVVGSAQAVVEIWNILSGRGAIPVADQDSSFAAVVEAFGRVHAPGDLMGAARTSLDDLFKAAGDTNHGGRQDRLVELLVGQIHSGIEGIPSPGERFVRMFDAQALIPIDYLLAAADHSGKAALDPKAVKNMNDQIERLRENETLHGSLSAEEKNLYGGSYWSARHVALERKFDLETMAKNPDKRESHAVLAALLRDSLVGMVYCYYAPPGSQIMLTNPLFVRSHDFVGLEGAPAYWAATDVSNSGWPASAGGRLYGSLVSVPYVLAQAEQNFMTPRREQALIWSDLVPQMVIGVTIPRWRNVLPTQLRWVSLHIERGKTLIAAAGLDSKLMPDVMDALGRHLAPGEVDRVRLRLLAQDFQGAISQVPPAIFYAISEDPSLAAVSPDVASMEIAALASANRPELTEAAIARAFGTPKPTLTHSYKPALLYVRTFPALMGFSSRILAETWESNNLYYAALADEAGIPAAALDTYVPEWNRSAIENIYAANLEDWPALIRSLNVTASGVLHRTSGVTQQASAEGFRN